MHAFLLLPVWIKELGGTDSDIGFIMGATSFSTIFSTPLVGFLVDKYDKKILLLLGSILLVLTGISFVALNNLSSLFFLFRILQGIAFSLFFVSAGTLVTEVCPKENRTQALGIFGVFTIINYAIAPYIGRRIVEQYSFDYFFIFISVIGFLSLPFIFNISKPGANREEEESFKSSNVINIIKRPGIFIPAVTLMFAGSGFIPTLSFLPVFSLKLNIKEYEVFFVWYTMSVLFIRLLVGWLPDKIGKIKTVVPSLILFSFSILYLGFTDDKLDLIISGILFGFGHGFLYPTLYSIVIDNSNFNERGKVFSICSVAFTLGGMIGAFSYGLVAEVYDYFFMYKLIGTICLLGFFIFIFYYRNSILRLNN
jgi:MFS family permease